MNQSAHIADHSIKTAFLKIHNGILLATDENKCIRLFLLDINAAFDTGKHSILLHRFKEEFGIVDAANEWVASYFSSRTQQVNVTGVLSDPISLESGMLQGSILGP